MSSRRRRQEEATKVKINFELRKVSPLTKNQTTVFETRDKHQLLYGLAGTGKTYLAMYLALEDILEHDLYKKIVIVRSAVSGREIGHLPGNEKEKISAFEEPYDEACTKLFGRGDAYQYLKNRQVVEFKSTSFLRGITLDDCVLYVDELQNMTAKELNSIMTRVGKNCRVVISGDCRQDDLQAKREKTGARDFMKIAKAMSGFEFIEFSFDDIVRSGFVKQYLITRDKLERSQQIETL